MENNLKIGKGKIGKLTIGVEGGDPKAVLEALSVATKNTVNIDDADIQDVVVGIRITSSADVTEYLVEIKSKLDTALADDQSPDAQTARTAIAAAASEADKAKPDGKSLIEKIETGTSALKNLSEVAEKAAKVGPLLVLARAVYHIVKTYFGI